MTQNKKEALDTIGQPTELTDDLLKIVEGRHHEPFSVLGRHEEIDGEVIRVLLPHAEAVQLGEEGQVLERIQATDLFEYHLQESDDIPEYYTIDWVDDSGNRHTGHDPYSFVPQLSEFDIHLFSEGKHWHIYRILGAHPCSIDDIKGVRFAVWAPNAQRVSVVGDFNRWDGRSHSMHLCGGGIWELFIPEMEAGTFYKFEIRSQHGEILLKTDPYGQQFQLRPETASVVLEPDNYIWNDKDWLQQREKTQWLETPISVYEVHLGSWRLNDEGEFLSYRELARQLVAYVKKLGFTHIELMPVTEHPLDISWGYQTTGYFAPTRRHGEADDFRYFVDTMHQNDIGVLLDWVPAHFPKDAHGLALFDGTALYEHADPRQGEHRDWGTLIYNYGRNEVKNFLLGSAIFWLEEYHLDGLRVDAVASMLYLDYSREEGDWIPNQYGGNENLEAIDFMRDLNIVVHEQHPGAMVVAEESTSWPQVTRPTWTGGLGFSIKWNMGWMHDTLVYMSKEPIHRTYHHDQITFGLLYAFTENFLLPFSHDEVVHGKQSMINKMPGDEWQRFANLRLLYTYMYAYPGKKLLFMGCEFAQGSEWNCKQALDWYVLDYPQHQGIQTLVGDLNHLYRNTEALHKHDFSDAGFEWLDCHDSSQSVLSFLRKSGDDVVVGVFNFTPVVRKDYRLGVPLTGNYVELINSDSSFYGGSNTGNAGQLTAEEIQATGRPYSINLVLPPLAGIILAHQPPKSVEVEVDAEEIFEPSAIVTE